MSTQTKDVFKVGDRVAFSANYLRWTGQQVGEMPFARGEVVSLKGTEDYTIAEVKWDGPDIPSKIATHNLARIDVSDPKFYAQ